MQGKSSARCDERDQRAVDRGGVGRRAAAEAGELGPGAGAGDERRGEPGVERRQLDRGVLQQVDGEAAGAEQDHRAEHRVVAEAGDQLDAPRAAGSSAAARSRRAPTPAASAPGGDGAGGGPGLAGGGDVERDAAEVGLVHHVGRDELDDDPAAGAPASPRASAATASGVGRDAAARAPACRRRRARPRSPRARSASRRPARGGGPQTAAPRARAPAPARPPPSAERSGTCSSAACARPQSVRWPTAAAAVRRRVVAGDAAGAQRPAGVAGARAAHPAGEDRLAADHAAADAPGHRVRDRERVAEHARAVQDEQRVDAAVGGQRVERGAVALGGGVGAQVERIAAASSPSAAPRGSRAPARRASPPISASRRRRARRRRRRSSRSRAGRGRAAGSAPTVSAAAKISARPAHPQDAGAAQRRVDDGVGARESAPVWVSARLGGLAACARP